ncbi:MAG: hypothetical protein ACNS61_14055 [Candidatus Wenzhouxiangella sp. M2_3B_020]
MSMSRDSPSRDDSEDSPAGLTDDDYDRIAAFARTPPEDRNPNDLLPEGASRNGTATSTSETTCKRIRRSMSEADTVREVMENYPGTTTSEVMRHAYGECSHDHDIPATASPQIGEVECRTFRERFTAGYSVAEIADEFYRSDNTVTRHIFGRCSHSNNPRRLSVSGVPEEECSRLRGLYKGNENVDVRGAATAMSLRVEVAATHLFGYCECEYGHVPAEEVEEW